MATPLQSPCLENPHGQRNPAGYSPWDRKESDTIEGTHTLLLSCGCSAKTLQFLMDLGIVGPSMSRVALDMCNQSSPGDI